MSDAWRRSASIATLAALGVWLVACQREDLARSEGGAHAQAAQRQSVIGFAQTLRGRMRQCTSDSPDAENSKTKASVSARAAVQRNQEARCTQLMTDLGSGAIFPRDWAEDQRAKFRHALNTYAKYAAQNMARSQSEAMFMESLEDDQDGKIERYTKAMGPHSLTFRDRGAKLF